MKTHIKGFGIENFRVFDKMQEFKFAPITILTGTNSSGKSTLTKAIMILKESFNKKNLAKLDINAPYLKIGGYEKNINKIEKENIFFKIDFINPIERQDFESSFKVLYDESNTNSLLLGYDKDGIFKTEYSINEELLFFWQNLKTKSYDKIKDSVKWKIVPTKLHFETITYKQIENSIDRSLFKKLIRELKFYIQEKVCCNEIDIFDRDLFLILNILKDSIRSINDENIAFKLWDENDHPFICYQPELPKIEEMISDNLKNELSREILQLPANNLIKEISLPELNQETLSQVLNQIHYIAGVRAKQEIVFTIDEYPLLCEVLTNYEEYLKTGSVIRMINKDGGEEVIKRKKYSFLEKWLVDEFKIVSNLKDLIITPIDGYGLVVKINNDISLNQVGYGFTQLLPLILQVVFLENNVFIIEEPESNLHPALQSKLANFFSEAAKNFEIQFIIETHSEYLIRKLQYLTAKKEIKPEDTKIYYFYPPNNVPVGEKQIYAINIKEDGRLSKPFGSGFFDESSNLMIELINLNLN
jgi:predicted ATPase